MNIQEFIKEMPKLKVGFDIGYRSDDKKMFVWVYDDISDGSGLHYKKETETLEELLERVFDKYNQLIEYK